jgi:hypothetical protein
MRNPFQPAPSVTLGTTGSRFFARRVRVPLSAMRSHAHIIGASSSGKSRFVAGLCLALLAHRVPIIVIDPHQELAELLLAHLVAQGAFRQPGAFERLLYLDIPGAQAVQRFLPYNILRQPGSPHDVASNVKRTFHRAFPELAQGAPMFDTLVENSVKVFISNDVPLTALFRFLTDHHLREQLLAREDDADIVAFFHDGFDRLALRDQIDQAGAALRRAQLLTFNPVLKFSLSQSTSVLDFARILHTGQSVIVNLKLTDEDAVRLFGCLMTVGAQTAAKSRPPLSGAMRPHFLVIDEFHLFVDHSEGALASMLSETRKFGLFAMLVHQDWQQTPARLKGALSNVGLEAVFKLDYDDAVYTARKLGRVEPKTVRQTVSADESESVGMNEQWQRWTQAIQDLTQRHAFVRLPDDRVVQLRSMPVPNPLVDAAELERVKAQYLKRYFRPLAEVAIDRSPPTPVPTTTEPL